VLEISVFRTVQQAIHLLPPAFPFYAGLGDQQYQGAEEQYHGSLIQGFSFSQCPLLKPHSSWGTSPRHTEAHIADLEGRHGTLHPPDRRFLQQMPSNKIEGEEEVVEAEGEAQEMLYWP